MKPQHPPREPAETRRSMWPTWTTAIVLAIIAAVVMGYVALEPPNRTIAKLESTPRTKTNEAPPAPSRPVLPGEANAPPVPKPPRESPTEPAPPTPPTPQPEPVPEPKDAPPPDPPAVVAQPADEPVRPEPPAPRPDQRDVAAPSDVPPARPVEPSETVPAQPATGESRFLAAPDKAALATKVKEIQKLFKAEYASRDPAAHQALAERLARDAHDTPEDPVAAYALASEAREQAIQAADYVTFTSAGYFLAERYGVDTHDEDILAFGRMQNAVGKSAGWYEGLYAELGGRVETCRERDDFDLAIRYANVLKSIAVKASDVPTVQVWTSRIKDLSTLRTQFASYKAARDAVRANPSDVDASTKWGTYLCLLKGDFSTGLPLLLKGSDQTLAALAKRDLNPSRDATETVAIADEWWAYGEKSRAFRTQAMRRAGELYQAALPRVSGLVVTKIEKRLAEIASTNAPPRPVLHPVVTALVASPWSVHWHRAIRPQDIEGLRRGNGNVDDNDWSHDETITFYEDGRVDSRYFDRYELGPDYIALHVPRDDGPQPPAGPPGWQRDRRLHGRAILVGDELRVRLLRGDRIDDPRNEGTGTHPQANGE